MTNSGSCGIRLRAVILPSAIPVVVCAQQSERVPSAHPTLLGGPSTSPLDLFIEAVASFFATVGLPLRHGRLAKLALLPGLSG